MFSTSLTSLWASLVGFVATSLNVPTAVAVAIIIIATLATVAALYYLTKWAFSKFRS